MKTNIKAAVLATGLIASAGALLPLSVQAIGETTETASISVNVKPTITLDISSNTADSIVAETNTVSKGIITAKVTSNAHYEISLSAANPDLTSASTTDKIEAIPNGGTSTLPTGTSAWGIKKPTDTDLYTGLTASNVPFFTSNVNGNATPTEFEVGIMVAPSLSAGTYSTEVTVTASTTS